VLFSSHNTHDVEQLADTIAFIHGGRLLACADKERFLGDWRRVLCLGETPDGLSAWPELAQVRSAGRQVELKVRRWDDALPERLVQAGLEVQRVDPMQLEDIFVTTVRARSAA
jgi:ABC-2 type transport system ATP-binding protein